MAQAHARGMRGGPKNVGGDPNVLAAPLGGYFNPSLRAKGRIESTANRKGGVFPRAAIFKAPTKAGAPVSLRSGSGVRGRKWEAPLSFAHA